MNEKRDMLTPSKRCNSSLMGGIEKPSSAPSFDESYLGDLIEFQAVLESSPPLRNPKGEKRSISSAK
ncbi:unnamed protein product [Amoebophrya sp. A25]|nr:unnamed protein product [Amoebophrya sp. A25]|eukprot:GSA25T00019753001.1